MMSGMIWWAAVSTAFACQDATEPVVKSIRVLEHRGGRVDWSRGNGEWIAFDRRQWDGFYDIFLTRPDGTGEHCITEGVAGLPQRNLGQPAWHPSGKYMVFQAEKAEHPYIFPLATNPGAGIYNDLWVMDMETRKPYLLRKVPNDVDHGILHPHFSRDGKKVSWTECYERAYWDKPGQEAGSWRLKVADFVVGSLGPRLANIKTYRPGAKGWYENHGFSPDGTKLIFSSSFEPGRSIKFSNIYTLEFATGAAKALTSEAYNEHAHTSPDGMWIAWMTDKDNVNKGTDWWIMSSDGILKYRLTHFNDPLHADYKGYQVVAADLSWAPDGKRFAGYYHALLGSHEKVLIIELQFPAGLEDPNQSQP